MNDVGSAWRTGSLMEYGTGAASYGKLQQLCGMVIGS